MNRLFACLLLLAITLNIANAQNPKSTTEDAAKHKAPTGFVEKLLKFLGIADNPSTLKGPGEEVVTGDVWLADLEQKTTHALTTTGGYRSPIFMSGSKSILALQGADVVQIPSAGGNGRKLYSIDGITKLVGCNSEDADQILILLRDKRVGRPVVRLLTISTGATALITYDSSSDQDLQMVESLQGWTRKYGDSEIYVESQSKQVLSVTVEWTDVFLKVGNAKPVDVSQCAGTNCGQPSLADNKRIVVFVKSEDR